MESTVKASILVNENHKAYMKLTLFLIICRYAPVVAVLSGFSNCTSVCAAESEVRRADLPKEVRDALDSVASVLASVRLDYTVASAGDALEGYAGPEKCSDQFDNGRFYHRRQGFIRDTKGKLIAAVHEDAFDGQLLYSGNPDLPIFPFARLVMYSSDDESDPLRRQIGLFQFPYLDAAGFYAPNSIPALKEPFVESLVLHHLRDSEYTEVEQLAEGLRVTVRIADPVLVGARQAKLEEDKKLLAQGSPSTERLGAELEVLERQRSMEPKRTISFILSAQYGYGVLQREERTYAGQLILHIESKGWAHYGNPGIWLPRRCIVVVYTNPLNLTQTSDKPLWTETSDLDKVTFGHGANVQFSLHYSRPGTLIQDRSAPEARNSPEHAVVYTIAADGKVLTGAAFSAQSNIRHRRVLPAIYVSVLLVPLLIALIHRYLRNRAKSAR